LPFGPLQNRHSLFNRRTNSLNELRFRFISENLPRFVAFYVRARHQLRRSAGSSFDFAARLCATDEGTLAAAMKHAPRELAV
jgi:hypothetical protein